MSVVWNGLAALAIAGGLVVAGAEPPGSRVSAEAVPRQVAAVAFDYFVLFNPDSVVSAVDRVVPGQARDFTNLWRTRQFEYCWLRSITNRYVDFSSITEDALVYTANAMRIALSPSQKQTLLDACLHLTPWPDAAAALGRLRQSGVRIITIANFSSSMLRSTAERAGLLPLFDALVSTDANHSYKPDARAYRLGVDRLAVPKEQIVFAAFGGWDAAGAKSFGYPTVWVNRSLQAPEELGVSPDGVVRDLGGLVDFVLEAAPAARSAVR